MWSFLRFNICFRVCNDVEKKREQTRDIYGVDAYTTDSIQVAYIGFRVNLTRGVIPHTNRDFLTVGVDLESSPLPVSVLIWPKMVHAIVTIGCECCS